jgi:hypothetical protein
MVVGLNDRQSRSAARKWRGRLACQMTTRHVTHVIAESWGFGDTKKPPKTGYRDRRSGDKREWGKSPRINLLGSPDKKWKLTEN